MRVNEKELLKNIDKENHRNEEKVKIGVFGLFYLLLKNQSTNIWMEIIYITITSFQLISFPFDEIVKNIFIKKL